MNGHAGLTLENIDGRVKADSRQLSHIRHVVAARVAHGSG
jgi:hypothetical protein